MDKVFDLIFAPKGFFKNSTFGPFDTLIATLIIWIVNAMILFPVLKDTPLFGGFFDFSVLLLAFIFLYNIFAGSFHMFFSKSKNAFWGFSYVMMPNILTGWIFSVAIFWNLFYILLIIPVGWSVLLEFYLVRSSMGKGILYTLIMRIARDLIFLIIILFIFNRGLL